MPTLDPGPVRYFVCSLEDGSVIKWNVSTLQYETVPTGGGGGPHAASHQNNGADEISVAGLSGVLADPQTPATHSHSADIAAAVSAHEAAGDPHLGYSTAAETAAAVAAHAGTNTHAQIDSHLASTANPHGVTAAQAGALGTTAFSGLAKITVGTVAPGSPSVGDLWVDSN